MDGWINGWMDGRANRWMDGWAPDSKGHRLDGEAEGLCLDPVVHLQEVRVNTNCKERFSIEGIHNVCFCMLCWPACTRRTSQGSAAWCHQRRCSAPPEGEISKTTEEPSLVDHFGEALDIVDFHRWERELVGIVAQAREVQEHLIRTHLKKSWNRVCYCLVAYWRIFDLMKLGHLRDKAVERVKDIVFSHLGCLSLNSHKSFEKKPTKSSWMRKSSSKVNSNSGSPLNTITGWRLWTIVFTFSKEM